MKQIFKKLLCSLLAVLMIVSIAPVQAYASTPAKVNDAVIEERIAKLKKLKGKYFTVSGNPCAYISGHGCTNCGTPKLINTDWIEDIIGMLPDSINRLPEYHVNDDFRTTQNCQSCRAFASIAHWFIYAQKSTDTVKIGDPIVSEATFNATTMKKAKKGDILAILDSSGNHYHSVIFLECVNGGIKVLDCNWNGKNVGSCKVQEWTMSYSSSYYSKVTISRATNYTEETIPVFGAEIIDSKGNPVDSIKIEKGDAFQLGVKIYPDNATNKAVTWSSRDTSVATVSSSGLVTAKGTGNTVIVAETKDGGYKITCDVEVTEKTCLVHFYVGDGYISTPNMEVSEGTYITIPREIPICPGSVFAGWQTTNTTEGEWTKTKPISGDYKTGYRYYTWGYEHNSDYTYLYGDDKNELIEHIKKNSGTFGSYNPKKMRYFYRIESSDKGSSYYPGKSGTNYNYFNVDYVSEDGKVGTVSIYKTVFYFESNVYKQNSTVAVTYQPGDSYLVNKDTVFTATWKEAPPTIILDSFECTPNCTVEYNVRIENNDVTENLSFDLDFVYDKTAFEIESIETFFPKDGVVSVSGDNVKYNVTDGEVGSFNGLFATVILNVKDAKIKDYVFTIKVNKWVNSYGNIEPKIVDGIIKMNHSACIAHYSSPVECYLPEDAVYEYGDEIVIADALSDEDWEFVCWSDDNGINYRPGERVKLTDDFYLTASWKPKWTPVITVENASGAPGETIAIPVNVKNNQHSENTSVYVLIDTGNAIYQDFKGVQGLPVNGNIGTIYVKIPETAKNGDSYIISAVPTTFSVFEENGVIEIFEYVQTKTGVLTVEEPEPQTYTVTYNANGGSGAPSAQTKTENKALTLSTTKPTRNGYEFLGWATSANAGTAQYQPGGSYTANANATLYAVWKKIPVTYTVSYNANGGSGAPSAQTKTENKALTLSTTKPTRNGYEFLGWAAYANAGTAQYQPGGSYTANANVTLYAVWKQKEVIPADAPTIIIGEVSGKAGEVVEVPVILKNNPGVAVIGFDIVYDKTAIKLVDYKGTGLDDWLIGVGKGEKANWVDEKGSSFNGEILVLEFEILKEAKDGSAEIAFTNFKAGNKNNEKLNFVIDNGKIEIVSRIPGDSNNDGEVDVFDLLILRKHLAGIPEEINLNASDVNADGEVDVFDLLLFRKYLAGMDAVLK